MKSIKILQSLDNATSKVIHNLKIISQEKGNFTFSWAVEGEPGINYHSFRLDSNNGLPYDELGKIRLMKLTETKTEFTVWDPEWRKVDTLILFHKSYKNDIDYLREKGTLDHQIKQFEDYLERHIIDRDKIISEIEKALKKR